MNRGGGAVDRTREVGRAAPLGKPLRGLLGLLLAASFFIPAPIAYAQGIGGGGGGNPLSPKLSLGGAEKRKLTPEEEEQQKKIDADYKAAASRIPAQKALDPWGDVRQAPAGSGQKTSSTTQNASAPKKRSPTQQAQ
jgi:hypothetical protein